MTTDFKHDCPDWDFMTITKRDPEFLACTCAFPEEHAGERRKAIHELERECWEQFPDEGHGCVPISVPVRSSQ